MKQLHWYNIFQTVFRNFLYTQKYSPCCKKENILRSHHKILFGKPKSRFEIISAMCSFIFLTRYWRNLCLSHCVHFSSISQQIIWYIISKLALSLFFYCYITILRHQFKNLSYNTTIEMIVIQECYTLPYIDKLLCLKVKWLVGWQC